MIVSFNDEINNRINKARFAFAITDKSKIIGNFTIYEFVFFIKGRFPPSGYAYNYVVNSKKNIENILFGNADARYSKQLLKTMNVFMFNIKKCLSYEYYNKAFLLHRDGNWFLNEVFVSDGKKEQYISIKKYLSITQIMNKIQELKDVLLT